MSKPFFSIIIPCLNEEKYIPNILNDLANQTFRDFEVIVVDGKSTDDTINRIKKYKTVLPSLTIQTSEKRHVCTQRNLGSTLAKANTLIFSDADNRIKPFFLQGIKYRIESTGSDIISPFIEPDIKNAKNDAVAKAFNLFLDTQMSIKPTYLLESMVIINKEIFEKIGRFNEKVDYAEGKELLLQAIKCKAKIKMVKDPTYSFSFRRLRKYGILGILSRMAQIGISSLLEGKSNKKAQKLYPMLGGALFEVDNSNKKKFQKKISQLLKKLQEF